MQRFPWEENLPETETEQWMASCLTECWLTGHTASQRCLCSAGMRFFSQSRAENYSWEQRDLVLMCSFVELMDKDLGGKIRSLFQLGTLCQCGFLYIHRGIWYLRQLKVTEVLTIGFHLEHEVWSWRCLSYCDEWCWLQWGTGISHRSVVFLSVTDSLWEYYLSSAC